MVLQGDVREMTRTQFESSGLELQDMLSSDAISLSDLRSFNIRAQEVHEIDPDVFDEKKLASNGFLKDQVEFMEGYLMKGISCQHACKRRKS